MNLMFLSPQLQNGRLAAVLVDAALKGIFLLSLAWLCSVCLRKLPAAARHLIWFGAVVGVLCFPIISWLAPAWERPLWTVGTRLDSGNQVNVVVALRPERTAARTQMERSGLPGHSKVASMASENRRTRTEFRLPWLGAGLAVWGTGVIVVLSLVCVGQVRLRGLRHDTRLLPEEWEPLLQELRRQLHLRRSILLLQSNSNVMPVTWGWVHPVILLPAQAGEWPIERRRVVLVHELAHVKRWDCLSQFVAGVACAIYWFNPLAWVALRQMRIERERACDDRVIDGGVKASVYAVHLVEIASTFASAPRLAGVAMARSSQLTERISSIVAHPRSRRRSPLAILAVLVALGTAILAIGGNEPAFTLASTSELQALLARQLAQLRSFSAAKLKQSLDLAALNGEQISPEFQRFFNAAATGDYQTVTNMYEDFKRRHPQYSKGTNAPDLSLRTSYWSPVLEICLAYDHIVRSEPKYTALLANGIINSIPIGSIYFGGTDPGRGIPTAFSKSHADGDPFFTLTQNALADGSYLEYLKQTYGGAIYTPSTNDSQKCFGEYCADALRRLEHDRQFPLEPKQIHPGENVRMEDGKGAVSGQTAVMGINGLLAKIVFDQNPTRDFYIEESFPLDWMYPYLEPHGLIMRINREPLLELPGALVTGDRAYWQDLIAGMLGDWLNADTSADQVASFVRKVYVQNNLSGFSGDPAFIQNDYSKRVFSKLRSSIGGVYAWRAAHAANTADAQRMATEADLAFRQAFALCPYSPEAVFRYATFLSQNNRLNDALLIAASASAVAPKNTEIRNLISQLKGTMEFSPH